MLHILLLEDDPVLSNEIQGFLKEKEVACDTVYDGDLFFKQMKTSDYDIYLLDINVPKINGLDVCERIRQSDVTTPILMLTAFGEIDDKIEAFSKGADDYLVKPFHLEELYIRIQALFRRKIQPQIKSDVLKFGDLVIDLDDKKIFVAKQEINLTPKEFKLLTILATANGRVLSKQQIADQLWDYHIETTHNTIEVYINFLRNKIDKTFNTQYIQTKVGFGYYLKTD
ncbi:MAG: response regulator transcription factor [Chitinophagales bacterium]|nr:response regulator transcription factor [Chitinophagales bacterium]